MRIETTKIFFAAFLAGAIISGPAACDFVQKTETKPAAHEDHDEHGDHAGEKGHDEHGEEGHGEHDEEIVRLSEAQIEEFGAQISTAGPGRLKTYVTIPGEIAVNADRMAHIVPRVSGVVREVRKKLGDHVKAGEVMAVLESRELSDAKAEYLAAYERLALAEANYEREKRLWKKKVSSEQDYLSAKQALAEVRIEIRSAEQKLHALGFSDEYLKQLPKHADTTFTRYEITAPFSGTVIEKHITLGEAVKDDSTVFVVADLKTVWVNLSAYQKDLPFIKKGARVVIKASHGIPDAVGTISYVGPIVGEQTRTALVRVVLPNKNGALRPGLFVSGNVEVDEVEVPVYAPKTALQELEGETVVFVKTDEGFEPKSVVTGRSDETGVEIVSGLEPGWKYVSKGAFTLKAQLSKSAFGEGHSH